MYLLIARSYRPMQVFLIEDGENLRKGPALESEFPP